MQCNGDKTDCQDGSQLGRRESGRTTDNKPRGRYAMDVQYVRHDTHKANSQAQAGNDCGSGTHSFTTHIRHSYTEGYAYAEGYAYTEGYAYAKGYAYGFTRRINFGDSG